MTWAVVFAFCGAGAVALIALNVAARALDTARRVDRDCYEMGRYIIDHLPVPDRIEIELIDADVSPLTEN
jgi:hypothetical protein